MKIAVDAMGSDAFPLPDVQGALDAVREYDDVEVILVGDQAKIEPHLGEKNSPTNPKISIYHTTEYITHSDSPSSVGRQKPKSSMMIAMQMVEDGQADGCVTAGNTGAALALATLHSLKRIKGVKRPMLTAVANFPTHTLVLADIGANTDCKADWLEQFAWMASLYAEHALRIKNPKVGLLANGEEESKGDQTIQEANGLLKGQTRLNFVGNVEPKDALRGAVDVVIHDGMLGNIFIKSMEAFGGIVFDIMRTELTVDTRSKVGAALARPAFRRTYRQIDPFEIGGTLLIGVQGVVIVGHGRSNALAIKNCIRQAREAVQADVVGIIQSELNA